MEFFHVVCIVNPFAAGSSTIWAPSQDGQEPRQSALETNPRQAIVPRPPPSLLEPLSRSPTPVSRKRGWHPAFAEPSTSTTTTVSTSAHLYPPARYGDYFMSSVWTRNPHLASNQDAEQEMPPLKKRRGLAGTIISTAINAALIGSAVGLTVYRLWRNRGKLPQRTEAAPEPRSEALPPPPPYDAPSYHPQDFNVPKPVHVLPSSPKKPRQARQNKHPAAAQHRRKQGHRHRTHPDHLSSSSDPCFPTRPEFAFEREPHADGVEDKMDWIGDKLSMLIQQGKRALNTHVVVSSDAIEDEVDDGSDAWEEENGRGRPSRSASVRHFKRPKTSSSRHTPCASSSSPPPPFSSPPRFADLNFPVSSSAPNNISVGLGGGYSALAASHSTTSLNNINIEDPSSFESRELRESMERARQRLMARRLGGGGGGGT